MDKPIIRLITLFVAVGGWAADALSAPGDLDSGYDPDSDSSVFCSAVQPDGKMIIGGIFTDVGGETVGRIARLNADGTVDTGFNAGAGADGQVDSVAVQPDGKILVGGFFTTMHGTSRIGMARLNANGTLDTGFDPGILGINSSPRAIAIQPDGKILIGGAFHLVNGTSKNRIARLEANGALDTSFDPGTGADQTVFCLALQPNGDVVIGGAFLNFNGVGRSYIARLADDGSLDVGFNPVADGFVLCMALRPDGKIVIGGGFDTIGVTNRSKTAVLNADGTLDAFNPAFTDNAVRSLAIQGDGKVLIAGLFTMVHTTAQKFFARLNSNGTLDTGFNPVPSGDVRSVVVQADGKVVIGGLFTNVDGTARSRIARIENGAATGSLTVPSVNQIQWLRGGTAPETSRVIFESSTNSGGSWSSLGDGIRISGGWELTGLNLIEGSLVRGRAFVRGGYGSGSAGIVEAEATVPGGGGGGGGPNDTWSQYHNLALTYYQYYAAFGLYDYATAFYYYYYGIGDFYFYAAYGNQALADFSYYNGFGLYFLYLYGTAGYSSYYYYLAFAYYYYFVGVGDFNSANLYYNAYITAAFGG